MNKQKVWFITGAGRGMGAQLAKTALAAGYQVVATGRNTDHITKVLGNEKNLFVLKLDVTKPSRAMNMDMFHNQNGQQSGDPEKLADALLMIAGEAQPPRRFVAGADAVGIAERKIVELRSQIDAYRNLSTSLSFHD
jgi:NADP-dependent 3-hydroxy acid dehydrogenase YdfG